LLLGSAAASALAGVPLLAYMRNIAPYRFEVRRERLAMPGLESTRPVRIAHLSDLHWSRDVPDEILIHAFDLALAEKPDLVCITGDFVTSAHIPRPDYPKLLRRLSDRVPTLASMGNHDGGIPNGPGKSSEPVRRVLLEGGIDVLHNSAKTIQAAGAEIEFVGLGDIWALEFSPPAAFPKGKPARPRIVLSHNPDTKSALGSYDWDLLLCGHTHGGQVVPPLLGPLWVPVTDRRYVHGFKPWQNRWINVSSGVGSLFGIRFNCPPEVVILELSAA
jgi:uncharacterized protein